MTRFVQTSLVPGVILLMLIGFLLFRSGLSLGFIADDIWLIAASRTESFPTLDQWWKGVADVPGEDLPPSPYYRPLVILSFFLNDLVSRDSPFGFHLFNLLLHLANTAIVFWLLLLMRHTVTTNLSTHLKAGVLEFGLALIFLAHPASTHNALWISGRTDLMVTFFGLLTIGAYLSLKKNEPRFRNALPSVFFVLALLSKETALVVPFGIFWTDVILRWGMRKGSLKEHWSHRSGQWLSFVCILAVYALLRATKIGSPLVEFHNYESVNEVLQQSGRQFSVLLFPVDSMTAYRFALQHPVIALNFAIAGFIGIVGLLSYFISRKMTRTLGAGALMIFGTFLVMLLWFPMGGITQRMVYPVIPFVLIWLYLCVLLFFNEAKERMREHAIRLFPVVLAVVVYASCIVYVRAQQWVLGDFEKSASIKQSALADLNGMPDVNDSSRRVILLTIPHAVRHSMILGNVDEDMHYDQTREFRRLLNFYQGIALVGQDRDALGHSLRIERISPTEFNVRALDEGQSLLLRESYYRRARSGDSMQRRLGTMVVENVHPYGRAASIRIFVKPELIDSLTVVLAYTGGAFMRIQ